MAKKKTGADEDPTVRHVRGAAPEYPEGTHPPASPDEQAWGPGRFSYEEMESDAKPDESTVAQTSSDPLEEQDAEGDGK